MAHDPLLPNYSSFFFFVWVPLSFWLFLSHRHFHLTSSFLYLLPLLLFILSSPPKSADHLNPHSSFLLLSFLRTTPQSQTTSQFNHFTPESYQYLCSLLFVLFENPHLAFILFVVLNSSAVQKASCYFFAPFVSLARRWLRVRDVWKILVLPSFISLFKQ